MILYRTDTKGAEPQGSPSVSPTPTLAFAYTPFLFLLADYCRQVAGARKRSILVGELAAYSSLADDDTGPAGAPVTRP
jgi:hypothetical protein